MKLLWVALLSAAAAATVDDYLVGDLPGLGKLPFKHYAGHIDIDPPHQRSIFFWLFESQHSPAADPVLMWLNGGPGCSSLFGQATEHGPVKLTPAGPVLNPHAWNRVANVLYVEAPVGVGFSFDAAGDYVTGDNKTADDNAAFVAHFFAIFPHLKANPFFISGESYAGHYVPQLAYRLLSSSVNFRGVMVGNPSGDWTFDVNSYFPLMARHGLLSDADFAHLARICNNTYYPASPDCAAEQKRLRANFALINPYNVLADCDGPGPSTDGGCLTHALASLRADGPNSQTFIPCIDTSAAETYFRREDVRAALHVGGGGFEWSVCSGHINYTQYAPSVRGEYAALKEGGVRVLFYSGDQDSCVPFIATERWGGGGERGADGAAGSWRRCTATLRRRGARGRSPTTRGGFRRRGL